jgi:hypothetical protein
MDSEVHVAELATPVRRTSVVPLLVQREAEHVTVEGREAIRPARGEQYSRQELNSFRCGHSASLMTVTSRGRSRLRR